MSATERQDPAMYDVVIIGGAAGMVTEDTERAVTAYRARREALTSGRR